jgi:hypothetical protein
MGVAVELEFAAGVVFANARPTLLIPGECVALTDGGDPMTPSTRLVSTGSAASKACGPKSASVVEAKIPRMPLPSHRQPELTPRDYHGTAADLHAFDVIQVSGHDRVKRRWPTDFGALFDANLFAEANAPVASQVRA